MSEFFPGKAPRQPKRVALASRAKNPVGRNSKVRAASMRTAKPWSDPLAANDPAWAERKRLWRAAIKPYTDRFDHRGDTYGKRGESW